VLTLGVTASHQDAVAAALHRYLQAMDLLERRRGQADVTQATSTLQQIADDSQAPRTLRAHALYQVAGAAAACRVPAEARKGFQRYLTTYPNDDTETALISLARAAILPATAKDRDLPVGHEALNQLASRFPQSRFNRVETGLQARIDFLNGRYGKAAATYFALDDLPSVKMIRRRMPAGPERDTLDAHYLDGWLRRLDAARRFRSYETDITEIDRALAWLNPNGAQRFVRRLLQEPDLAAPYFYYRLYHCDNKAKDLANLSALAERIARTHGDRLPQRVQTRLAEIAYRQADYRRALRWADRAVAAPHTGGRDRALYVRGAIRLKQRRYTAALVDFRRLVSRFPSSPLRFGTREEIALAAEMEGDLNESLRQYLLLGYKPDIAYLLDARMTPRQIASFLREHPRHPARALIQYSLGIRYLREERLGEARQWLRRVPPVKYAEFGKGRRDGGEIDLSFDTSSPDPLTTIDQIVALRTAVHRASGTKTAAGAAYRYASYFYTHGTLLFYNAALWQGERMDHFNFWWNSGHATQDDSAANISHMHDHEVYVHAKRYCLEVARRYPRSPEAGKALYRAACCEDRLSRYNEWWRNSTDHIDHEAEAARLMQRLARLYPHHPLAHEARKFALVFSGIYPPS